MYKKKVAPDLGANPHTAPRIRKEVLTPPPDTPPTPTPTPPKRVPIPSLPLPSCLSAGGVVKVVVVETTVHPRSTGATQ